MWGHLALSVSFLALKWPVSETLTEAVPSGPLTHSRSTGHQPCLLRTPRNTGETLPLGLLKCPLPHVFKKREKYPLLLPKLKPLTEWRKWWYGLRKRLHIPPLQSAIIGVLTLQADWQMLLEEFHFDNVWVLSSNVLRHEKKYFKLSVLPRTLNSYAVN